MISLVELKKYFTEEGGYVVDLENGVVSSSRTGEPLSVYYGGVSEEYLKYAFWKDGKRKKVAVAHVIWMLGANRDIPDDSQIHHEDEDNQNNRWDNLICVFDFDHNKLHGRCGVIEQAEEVPF